jgi:N-acetylglucosamine kinase-like BadF-type ATPase
LFAWQSTISKWNLTQRTGIMKDNIVSNMDYIIGVDGGGSKTLAVAANLNGAVLGEGKSGPSNLHVQGTETAFAALEGAIKGAQNVAGLSKQPLAACLGLAGADGPDEIAMAKAWWAKRFPGVQLHIVNDAWLALAAGTPAGIGVAIISGTGSIAVACGSDGKKGRSGGWGYLFGDEGSGYAIGLEALRVVSKAADGRAPATLLTDLLLAHFNLQTPAQLINKIYNLKSPRTVLARLATHVQAAAECADPAAQKILAQAGADLAALAVAAARQVGLAGKTPVAAAGGLLVHWPALQVAFQESATQAGVEPNPLTPVPVPAIGAVRLALQLLA